MSNMARLGIAAGALLLAALMGCTADTGALPEGPFDLASADAFGGSVTIDIDAPGWYGEPGGMFITKNGDPLAPDGAGMIVFGGQVYVYADPCEWSSTQPETPATSVDEVVTALQAQPQRDPSAPVDISVAGYAGTSITLHVPDDIPFSACDQGEFRSWVENPDPAVDSARYHQDPGQIDELYILDVNGVPVIIVVAYYDGTPSAVVDEMRAMVDSTTFGE